MAEASNRIASSRERVETQDAELAVREQRRDEVFARLQPALLALAADVNELAQSLTLQRNNLREQLSQVRAIEEAQQSTRSENHRNWVRAGTKFAFRRSTFLFRAARNCGSLAKCLIRRMRVLMPHSAEPNN